MIWRTVDSGYALTRVEHITPRYNAVTMKRISQERQFLRGQMQAASDLPINVYANHIREIAVKTRRMREGNVKKVFRSYPVERALRVLP